MMNAVKYYIAAGGRYVREHPNLLLVLLLLFILPLLFLYSNQQFLDAGRSNQDRLQKDRVGLLHDVMAALLEATDFDADIVQSEIETIAVQNPDIIEFRVAQRIGQDIVPLAAVKTDLVGKPEESIQLYKDATVRLDESIIFEFETIDGRQWYAYRALESADGQLYYIFTRLSLQQVDALFAATTQKAMLSLFFVYLFVAALAYWHIKMTDYRYLYTEAKQANETKDLFTNMIAHELRAPLTAIRGYSSMLEEKLSNPTEIEYAKRVRESSERLIAIVNDLLDVARLQSGKLKVENAATDISEVVNKVLDELRVSGQEKSISLKSEGVETKHLVMVDQKRFHQALTNLVSNAIKYTKQGSIIVALEDKGEVVELRVKDTGMGISSGDQKKLFAPFFRVENTDVSQITGTGLGMWITKQLIELMGGTIAVESIKGVGTHVVVTFKKESSK